MKHMSRTCMGGLLFAALLGLAGCGTTGPTGAASTSSSAVDPAGSTTGPTDALASSRLSTSPVAVTSATPPPAATAPPAPMLPSAVVVASTPQPEQPVGSGPRLVGPLPAAPPPGPGRVEGAPPSAPPPGVPPAQAPVLPAEPTGWLTYTSQTYRFTIVYPNTYIPLDQEGTQEQSQAQRLFQVRFQNQHIANGATAGLELPQFQIDVFDNTAALPLARWLDDHAVTGERAEATVGGQAGLKVTLMTMMAPNQFYYVVQGSYVYRLTPLGPFSERMLASFSLS